MFRLQSIALLMELLVGSGLALAQTLPSTRPTPPTRDPHTLGYVTASELPDGGNPPANADGNFIIGPTHNPAPEMSLHPGVPQGTVYEFTMNSAESKIYPGVARGAHTFGTPDPSDPAKLVVTTSHPAPYKPASAPKAEDSTLTFFILMGCAHCEASSFIAEINCIAGPNTPPPKIIF